MKPIMRFLMLTVALSLISAQLSADSTNTWPFSNSSQYEVSNPESVEVTNGVARLTLLRDEELDVEIRSRRQAGRPGRVEAQRPERAGREEQLRRGRVRVDRATEGSGRGRGEREPRIKSNCTLY